MSPNERGDGDSRPHKSRNLIESLNYATLGIFHAVRTQPNMRVHACIALLVLLAGVVAGVSTVELSILVLTVGMVMVAEMLNTAVEAVVDLITEAYHPLARVAKNVAAGAVLLAAIAAVFVGTLIFFQRATRLSETVRLRLEVVPETLILAAIGVVLIVVMLVKAGAPRFRVQGGFPSAHTALAFGLATLVWLLGQNGAVSILAMAIATLVGQTRVEAKFHTAYEVIAGGALGVLLTVAVFKLLG